MERERAMQLYYDMARIRAFERIVEELVVSGATRGLIHTSIGNEASAVAVCDVMEPSDYLLTGHRGHGHVLARGADPYEVMSEILGHQDGLCRGMGGSMHLVDMAHRTIGATGVVGGNLSMALGAAYSARQLGSDGVAVVFFGDGATSTGAFHEALNLAAVWHLPVLMVCENNTVAEFTSRHEHSVVDEIVRFAEPFAIPASRMVAVDAIAVREHAQEAIALVRHTPGPYLLELETRRLVGHYAGDPRRVGNVRAMADTWDPLLVTAERLKKEGWYTADELNSFVVEAEVEIRAAAAKAKAGKPASPHDIDALLSAT